MLCQPLGRGGGQGKSRPRIHRRTATGAHNRGRRGEPWWSLPVMLGIPGPRPREVSPPLCPLTWGSDDETCFLSRDVSGGTGSKLRPSLPVGLPTPSVPSRGTESQRQEFTENMPEPTELETQTRFLDLRGPGRSQRKPALPQRARRGKPC